ncbi:MAG: hypothetical protein ABI910_22540 [Gemmatimonadota bacterium]
MERPPKWYTPVAVVALLWNLFGCAAYLMDVRLTPDDVAKMSAAQQAMYAARPAWSVGATAIAVWCGAAGCLGLLLRRRWATALLIASLVGVLGQDLWLFALSGSVAQAGGTVLVLQGLVLVVATALVMLARNASAQGWLR